MRMRADFTFEAQARQYYELFANLAPADALPAPAAGLARSA